MMPSFRRLSAAEIAALEQDSLGARAKVAQIYDTYLVDFAVGDYGRAELAAGERRSVVRERLHAAAGRRGLALRFRPGPSKALIFHVEAAPPALVLPAPPVAASAQRRDNVAGPRDIPPPRPRRRRESAAERYHAVLPRWMREGQPLGRRAERKRRTR
jgi:hypothetical protein